MIRIVKTALLAASAASLIGCSSAQQAQSGGGMPQMPPVPVSIAAAVEEKVPIELRSFGIVEAFASVDIKSQVAGPLTSVRFTEGSSVNQGDLLFEIDPRPYEEALHQAQSALTKDSAQVKLAEANLARDQANQKNATSDSDRSIQLGKEGISTRQQQDQTRTTAEMAAQAVRADQAAIDSAHAALDSDRTAIETAQLNLSYCQIHAPISGRTGNLLVHAGNLVKANDIPLVVINQVSPIFVTFGVPERQLTTVTSKGVTRDLAVQATFDDSTQAVHGKLSVIDNKVDPATGTVRLKAVFDNADRLLWPGRFVNVSMMLDDRPAIVIPAESVQVGQQGSFVYVVKPDQSVEPRPLTVGATVDGKVIVEKGVAAGETVVTDGQSRLYPGAHIQTGQK
jgi:membrane fusion protein, multidrug efflux system